MFRTALLSTPVCTKHQLTEAGDLLDLLLQGMATLNLTQACKESRVASLLLGEIIAIDLSPDFFIGSEERMKIQNERIEIGCKD